MVNVLLVITEHMWPFCQILIPHTFFFLSEAASALAAHIQSSKAFRPPQTYSLRTRCDGKQQLGAAAAVAAAEERKWVSPRGGFPRSSDLSCSRAGFSERNIWARGCVVLSRTNPWTFQGINHWNKFRSGERCATRVDFNCRWGGGEWRLGEWIGRVLWGVA